MGDKERDISLGRYQQGYRKGAWTGYGSSVAQRPREVASGPWPLLLSPRQKGWRSEMPCGNADRLPASLQVHMATIRSIFSIGTVAMPIHGKRHAQTSFFLTSISPAPMAGCHCLSLDRRIIHRPKRPTPLRGGLFPPIPPQAPPPALAQAAHKPARRQLCL